ncbi:MAG: hypothetical protein QOG72_654 [Sphingomonadales bacterium]|jgi:hypothetical protein|nr:hypothetical protein [Sphingomonadales bacterium]
MPRLIIVAFVCSLVSASAAQSAPARGVNAPERAAGNPDKIVCKRFVRVGSLVDGYRTCKTKREWERERDNLRTINWSSPCNSAESGSCGGG